LYQELEASERRKQHAILARAFADQLVHHPETIVQTAHHFLEALPYAEPKEVVVYAQKAAEWARARHAYARAADYYERALAVLDLEPANPHQHAELLLALGHTQFVAGAVDGAFATLERAFELTRAHGRYDLFCRAILIWFQLRQDAASVDPTFYARIAEAMPNVKVKDAVFAQLQVARAMSTMFTAPMSERVSWVQEALALTRETTDLRARLEVLRGALRCYTRFTDGTTVLGLAEEMLNLAVALRSSESELEARQWRAQAVLELGRGANYDRDVVAYIQQAAVVSAPQARWASGVLSAAQLFLAGSLSESERVVRQTGKFGQDLTGISAFLYMLGQLFQIGLEYDAAQAQPILDEFVEGGERVLAVAPNFEALVVFVARARTYRGHADAAKEYLARMTRAHYKALDPLDRNFLPAMVSIADLACAQNDVAAANIVSLGIDAYEGWHAVPASGSVYMGPVSYWLGRLSLVRGQTDDALRQLDLAIRESENAGSVIFRAWSEYHLAKALPPEQAARKLGLTESARRAAQRYALGRLQSALDSVQNNAPGAPGLQ
jgi:tetratricopeptide (TPR) repeat protein